MRKQRSLAHITRNLNLVVVVGAGILPHFRRDSLVRWQQGVGDLPSPCYLPSRLPGDIDRDTFSGVVMLLLLCVHLHATIY